MTRTSVVENIGGVTLRYEHRATREVYVWPAGEAREAPEEVALIVTAAHPGKMRLREAGAGEEEAHHAEASPPERGHAHRWRAEGVCRCGLRREDHRRHSHHWRKDDTCRCGKRREEVRLR